MCHLVVLAFPSAINHRHGIPASFDLIKILKEKSFLAFIKNYWSLVSVSSGLLIGRDLSTSRATLGTSEFSRLHSYVYTTLPLVRWAYSPLPHIPGTPSCLLSSSASNTPRDALLTLTIQLAVWPLSVTFTLSPEIILQWSAGPPPNCG